ncbi:Hypothetical predicted protein, partial [Paramuricea clavata]
MIFILLDLGHGRNHLKKPNLHHPKDVLAPDPLYDEDQDHERNQDREVGLHDEEGHDPCQDLVQDLGQDHDYDQEVDHPDVK